MVLLMPKFYRNWRGSPAGMMSKTEALREAKCRIREWSGSPGNGRVKRPDTWAGIHSAGRQPIESASAPGIDQLDPGRDEAPIEGVRKESRRDSIATRIPGNLDAIGRHLQLLDA